MLLETKVEQITPLVSNPGRLLLTDKRLYFQPFNSVQAAGVEKWNLSGGASGLRTLQRRRHQLRPVGVELLFGGGGGGAGRATGGGSAAASALSSALFLALPSNAVRERLVALLCEHSAAVDDAAELPTVRATVPWHPGAAKHPAPPVAVLVLAQRVGQSLIRRLCRRGELVERACLVAWGCVGRHISLQEMAELMGRWHRRELDNYGYRPLRVKSAPSRSNLWIA